MTKPMTDERLAALKEVLHLDFTYMAVIANELVVEVERQRGVIAFATDYVNEVQPTLEPSRKRLAAAEKLIDGWNFEHNNKRDHCCKVLASGASECTCGLWEAERNYQALVAKQEKG